MSDFKTKMHKIRFPTPLGELTASAWRPHVDKMLKSSLLYNNYRLAISLQRSSFPSENPLRCCYSDRLSDYRDVHEVVEASASDVTVGRHLIIIIIIIGHSSWSAQLHLQEGSEQNVQTSRTQRPGGSRLCVGGNTCGQRTSGSLQGRRQTTRWADDGALERRKATHLGCHCSLPLG